jgi:hypothetical protein
MGQISKRVQSFSNPPRNKKQTWTRCKIYTFSGEKMNLLDLVSAFDERDVTTTFPDSGFFNDHNVIFSGLGGR